VSIPVDLTALRAQIARFGPTAFLVTTTASGAPHVTSVTVDAAPDELTMGCGRRTKANVEGRPELTLLWPVGPDPAYCLIVDARTVAVVDETLHAHPTSAVLHRVADARKDIPSCLPIETATAAD